MIFYLAININIMYIYTVYDFTSLILKMKCNVNFALYLKFLLVQESTYGTHIHEKREDREARFTGLVHDIVSRGGRCLIPVFALGRAQELLLILGQ